MHVNDISARVRWKVGAEERRTVILSPPRVACAPDDVLEDVADNGPWDIVNLQVSSDFAHRALRHVYRRRGRNVPKAGEDDSGNFVSTQLPRKRKSSSCVREAEGGKYRQSVRN